MRLVSELDPELLASITGRAKRQIRARMRSVRQAYPENVILTKSAALVARLLELPAIQQARSVALFVAMRERREVDLQTLAEQLLTQNKQLYYPFMDPSERGFRTGFRRVSTLEDLRDRGQKFAEPPHEAPEAKRGDIDVVIVPALAVSADGHRVGYGAGYYDATLPDVAPPAQTVIVAFDFQLLAELPHEPHDRAGDWIVTDKRTLEVGSA
jgi:5-formyltetrahydrofolate cyclo-ligase